MAKTLKHEIRDQAAHALIGGVVAAAVFIAPAPLNGALLGLACGAVREVTEGGNVVSKGSVLDMLFWTLGGLVVAMVLA